MEETGAPALKKLIEDPSTITSADWINLAWLFANLALRTPANIDDLIAAELEAIRQINESLDEQMLDLPPETIVNTSQLEDINRSADLLRSSSGQIEAEPFIALPAVAECIQKMEFFLTTAPEGLNFVTSDRPLALRRFPSGSRIGAGWGNEDAIGQIALSPGHFLLMFYRNQGAITLGQATAIQVEEWNEEILDCANQEVYSAVEIREAQQWMDQTGRWSE